MPSKIRIIFGYGDGFYAGNQVVPQMEYRIASNLLSVPPKSSPTWKRCLEMYKILKNARKRCSLLVLREEEGIPRNKSRYKQICQYLGIRKAILKKKQYTFDRSFIQRQREAIEEIQRASERLSSAPQTGRRNNRNRVSPGVVAGQAPTVLGTGSGRAYQWAYPTSGNWGDSITQTPPSTPPIEQPRPVVSREEVENFFRDAEEYYPEP